MSKNNEIIILIILFIIYLLIEQFFILFIIVYIYLILYTINKIYLIRHSDKVLNLINFSLLIILYPISYFLICDPNPFYYLFTFYLPFQNFFRVIFLIIFISYFVNKISSEIFVKNKKKIIVKNIDKIENESTIILSNINFDKKIFHKNKLNFFLSRYIYYFKDHKKHLFFLIIFLSLIQLMLFLYRIKFWIYFNDKKQALPIGTSKNTTYYIAASIVNMEKIIEDYIIEMKKLINYLGNKNVMVCIVENGDSKDNTPKYLVNFQKYLDKNKVRNKFFLTHQVDRPQDEGSKKDPGYERIKFYTFLRNKGLELLYEAKDIDFNNTKIIYFNDIVFAYEDIIKLIATNNEEYDAVCAMDFNIYFFDTWVSIDLDGNSLRHGYPYFFNPEGQEQVLNNKPVRIFSCWNGVIVLTASPFENKKVQFRVENYTIPKKHNINCYQTYNIESECTYIHIDMETLGYTKRMVNPDVKVAYNYKYYYLTRYLGQISYNIMYYFFYYFWRFTVKRNKYMSNLKDKNIKISKNLEIWYNYHKLNNTNNNTINN